MTSQTEAPLFVVVPSHNDEPTIEAVVLEAATTIERLALPATLLLIDNASTDRTPEILEAAAREYRNAVFERVDEHLGRGEIIERSWGSVPQGAWVTILPGDREFDFASIEAFWALRDSYDVILGYPRNQVVRPVPRRVASYLFHAAARAAYGLPFRFLNGMKLYRRDAFFGLNVVAKGQVWSAELLAKAVLRDPLLRIGEAPFVLLNRGKPARNALPPQVLTGALQEFLRGAASVSSFRDKVIAESAKRDR